MIVDGLAIPDRLLALLDAGSWPRTREEANRQNLRGLVPEGRIRRLAPEESRLYLYPPPFATVAAAMAGPEGVFWSMFLAPEQIAPERSILIADFGLGSDAPILLDYRAGPVAPRVIRLAWRGGGGGLDNHWVACSADFGEFADRLALSPTSPD